MAYLKMRSDIEVAVRDALNDPNDYTTYPDGSDSRWTRADMLYYLNSGIKDIRRKRPEAKLSNRDLIDFVEFSTTNHTNDSYTILRDTYYNMIINYIVWKCYAMDDVDEKSSKKAGEFERRYYGGM